MLNAKEINRRVKESGQQARMEAQTQNIRVAIRESKLGGLLAEEGLLVNQFHFHSPYIGEENPRDVQACFEIMKPDEHGGEGILAKVEANGDIVFIAGAGILPWSYKLVSERDWRKNDGKLRLKASLGKAMKCPAIYHGGKFDPEKLGFPDL